ncbi:MAG TPA: sigma-54 dependent transcriptional regulator [Thermohalobaculum sp.]|nr:sigma-54 dependent transcriptional regulator [Thermohalobaculum sp.]
MNAGRVILIDDEEDIRVATGQTLELAGHGVTAFARGERALERLGQDFDGIVVSDIRMPGMDGLELLRAARALDPELPVILITGHGDVPLAVEAMRAGAYDFVEKPFDPKRLTDAVARAVGLRHLTLENRALRSELEQRAAPEDGLVGRAPVMAALRQQLRAVAATDADALILGATGTGKELAARAVHRLSERRDRPFVAVNMAALPESLIESELFGHEAGAFAGAHRARFGKFEHARGGTLLLDEIGAVPLSLQAKLLRVIEERVIERLGSNEKIPLDVRFLASTKEDLGALVAEGRFRDDLYYRLAVVSLHMPPLAERVEDVPRLFQHLVNEAALRYRREAPAVTAEILTGLAGRAWPGNVRELRNAADRFVLGLGIGDSAPDGDPQGLAERVDRFEKSAIAAELAVHGGNLKATYESLGLSRKTLYEKMQRHRLRREDFGGADGD